MSNIQNQKSGLAKLLATENLTVQHQKIPTAAFDPKNRVLYCPIWQDMSGDLYDLLMGHEVGHALDTPSDGWHDAVHSMGKNYKGFLNVVEDARIEKRQKRRYPGLRSSFIKGYDELMKRDFFGLSGRDVNAMTFIDRLNLFTKSGYTMQIAFTDEELVMVEKVKECETWDDVLRVTNEVWDYSKKEQQENELPEEYDYRAGESDDGDDTETGNGNGDTETDGEGEEKGKSKGELNEDGDEAEGKSSDDGEDYDGDDEETDDELTDIINRNKESAGTDEHFEPTCETDDNFRRNESSLIAAKAREYVYVNIPTPNLNRIVTPAKRVQELLTEAFTAQVGTVAYGSGTNELYNEFRKKNERYISLLAKEFEMRKAASKFAKAKVSETGDIDVNKIYKYQIDDSIFKKIMRVPKGKSHGMILLLDKSGSMAGNLAASYEQILVLALFCRKVNIPFTAYGFGNARGLRDLDYPNEKNSNFDENGHYKFGHSSGCFSENVNEIRCSEVYLREMINSKMSNAEFSKSVKNILCLMDAWANRNGRGRFMRPQCDSLSNTPLTEALIALQPIIKEFRRVNNLDIVNTTIVHDGDADTVCWYHAQNDERAKYFDSSNQNVFLVDKKNKVQVNLKTSEDDVREGMCEWLQKTTGTKIVGFFLTPITSAKAAVRRRLFNEELNSVRHVYAQANEVVTKYVKQLKKEKYLESKNVGYDSFYILPAGNDLTIDDESFEVNGKVTTATLTKAFMKFNKTRQINRVLVSRFITQIAV
jgi:hypothetical protein